MTRSTAPRLRRVLVAGILAASVLTPTTAVAAPGDKVVVDCAEDGSLSKKYTAAEYADALKNIPTDVDEYTECRDVIRQAQLGGGSSGGSGSGNDDSGGGSTGGGGSAAGGGGSAGGGTGSGATTGGTSGDPSGGSAGGSTSSGLGDYEARIAGASPEDRAAIERAMGSGTTGDLSSLATRGDDSDNGLPTPLVIVLVLLLVGALAAAFPKVRGLVSTGP